MCLDVEVDGYKEVPNKISIEVEEGRDTIILIAELPPPPPAATRPSSFGAATRGAQARGHRQLGQPVDTGRSGLALHTTTPSVFSIQRGSLGEVARDSNDWLP